MRNLALEVLLRIKHTQKFYSNAIIQSDTTVSQPVTSWVPIHYIKQNAGGRYQVAPPFLNVLLPTSGSGPVCTKSPVWH